MDKYIKISEKELKGQRIIKAYIKKSSDEFDDEPHLFLEMEGGRKFLIQSFYGSFTGESEDEYPCFLNVFEVKDQYDK